MGFFLNLSLTPTRGTQISLPVTYSLAENLHLCSKQSEIILILALLFWLFFNYVNFYCPFHFGCIIQGKTIHDIVMGMNDCCSCCFLRIYYKIKKSCKELNMQLSFFYAFIGHWFDTNNFCTIPRGHSVNRPKGGRNSLQRYIWKRFADHFCQFLFTKSSEASSRSFIWSILSKTSLNSSCYNGLNT